MKPPTTADNMQDITDQSVADKVSQNDDTIQTTTEDATINTSDGEGTTNQEAGDRIPTPPKEAIKKKPKHKPMFAAEQIARMAEIKDKLKDYDQAAATAGAGAVQPVTTTESPPVEAVEPVVNSESPPAAGAVEPAVKKRKLSDPESPSKKLSTQVTPSPEAGPVAVPTKPFTPSPEQKQSSRSRSSNARKSSEPEDRYCPNKVKELMGKFNTFGVGFEKAVSGIAGRACKLIAGEDADSIRSRVLEMEREWKVANREQMQKMVQFMERNGVIAMGGVEVPSTSLDVPAQTQSEGASSPNE